jgi:hypothetical protein
MKPRRKDDEFNTPGEMLARTAFLVCLAAFTAGIVLTVAAVLGRDVRLFATGLACLAVGALTRGWLRRQGQFKPAEAAFDEFAEPGPSLEPKHVAELVRLLDEWEKLERQRGSPRFDPWALQSIRHDIREMIDRDPALEGLFRGGRSA